MCIHYFGPLCIYSIRPDDRLQICPKHIEVEWRNKLRINSASSWFSLHGSIEMHGQQNIKNVSVSNYAIFRVIIQGYNCS